MIGPFRSSTDPLLRGCSLSVPLLYTALLLYFFDHGQPPCRNFFSTIPVDVVRVKSYVDMASLTLRESPVRASIIKLYLVPDRIVAGLESVFRNCRAL